MCGQEILNTLIPTLINSPGYSCRGSLIGRILWYISSCSHFEQLFRIWCAQKSGSSYKILISSPNPPSPSISPRETTTFFPLLPLCHSRLPCTLHSITELKSHTRISDPLSSTVPTAPLVWTYPSYNVTTFFCFTPHFAPAVSCKS